MVDEKSGTVYVDTIKAQDRIEEVYTRYLESDVDFFKISEGNAQGFYKFLEEVGGHTGDARCLKGHITGPVSFGLFVTDQNKRPILYDRDLFEVATKVLSMKAVWQIRKLKEYHRDIIIFIDEPYLVSIGSSYVNIDRDLAMKSLDETIASIKAEGAMAGIHCCGNTDWQMLLKRDIDILNFDAYNFMNEFALYGNDLKDFLKRGGTIAWGIVPSSEEIDAETAETLGVKLNQAVELLTARGIARADISSIVTSSCGLGTLDEERAGKIFGLVGKIAKAD